MAASHEQIPNLLSGLKRGGGASSRGRRGRGGSSLSSSQPSSEAHRAAQQDVIIQQTDTDALHSRISAVNIGYIDDRYAESFTMGQSPRRLPIINRGTLVRTEAIDQLVERFLSSTSGHKQIVSLGAGTDTRYWRLQAKDLTAHLHYHEIDFPKVSANKYAAIRASPRLSPHGSVFSQLHNTNNREAHKETWGCGAKAEHVGYYFHPLDLRVLAEESFSSDKLPSRRMTKDFDLALNLLHPTMPTLIISECCLCYMETSVANKIITYFTSRLVNVGIVLYEPTNPNDDFGQMMFKNLASRHLSMPTVHAYPDFDSQRSRLRQFGFSSGQRAVDIDWLWENWIMPEERERVDELEGLDEVEEWKLLAGHYGVAWGWRERNMCKAFSRAWGDLCDEDEVVVPASQDVQISDEPDDEIPTDWAEFEAWMDDESSETDFEES